MALTPSTMPHLGMHAPEFALPDTTRGGKVVRLTDFTGSPALLVMFLCNHCPFVKHVRGELAKIGKEYHQRGVTVVAIGSNDVKTHPDDSPEKMAAEAAEAGYTFPYLFDESQAVAKAYKAACTPDFFLFDRNRRLYYRGQLDDSRPGKYATIPAPVTGKDLRGALEAVLTGRPAPEPQLPSMGCNIKWKPGNEPRD